MLAEGLLSFVGPLYLLIYYCPIKIPRLQQLVFSKVTSFFLGVGIRVSIRVRFGSIGVLDFRGQRFQPHSDISKFWFGFGSDLCEFGSGSDNPLNYF